MSSAAQSLPLSAREYARSQRAEKAAALAAVRRQWRRMGSDFDASWSRVSPTVLAIVLLAQARAAARAEAYIPLVLAETGQRVAPPELVVAPGAFVGVTGAGVAVEDSLAAAPIRAKQAATGQWVEESADPLTGTTIPRYWQPGAPTAQALATAGSWLVASVGTILADTARGVEGASMQTHRVTGYVRALSPPSCSRCVVLAGKWFRFNKGFDRHPGCDCHHIPAPEGLAGDLTLDPDAYFNSLDPAAKLKLAGSQANLRALEDGADLSQIVNAYRRSGGMNLAQVPAIERRYGMKFTSRGASDRSWTYQQQVGSGLRSPASGAPGRRLMPESIYANASSPDEALGMLRAQGWVVDPAARATGRALISEQTRLAREARRRARRRQQRLDRLEQLLRG